MRVGIGIGRPERIGDIGGEQDGPGLVDPVTHDPELGFGKPAHRDRIGAERLAMEAYLYAL